MAVKLSKYTFMEVVLFQVFKCLWPDEVVKERDQAWGYFMTGAVEQCNAVAQSFGRSRSTL